MKEHTRLADARRRIERRMFLKAMGLGLSLPLALKLSRIAVAQEATVRPKRLLLMFTPHGVPPEHYNPVVNGGNPTNFSLAQSGVSILGPLEPYKSLVNVLQGFKYPGASTHEGILTFLSNFPTANDETTPRTTFEHVIANALNATPLVLGAAAQRDFRNLDKDSKLTWDGQAVAPEKNPLRAFDKAFGSLAGGAAQGEVTATTQLRKALTALNESQLNGLKTELAQFTRTQTKLSAHLDAIASLGGAGAGQLSCTALPVLPAVEALRLRAPTTGDAAETFFLDQNNFPDILTAQLQVAAQALICGVTPVAVVQPMYTNAEFDFGFMGSAGPHHSGLSHTGPQQDGASANMATRTPFANAQRWFMQKLVDEVITRFDQPDPADPEHKIIDNTIIYICSEIGEGAWHSSNTRLIQQGATPMATTYLPLVTVGGGSGALKTGQVLNFNPTPAPNTEVDGDRPAGDIYLALCRAMGVPVTSFGSATNPVTEILA
jgi:hypothetical protein